MTAIRKAHRVRAVIAVGVAASVVGLGLAGVAVATPATDTTKGTQINACGNPILYSDLAGWGSLDSATVSRDSVGDHAVAHWAFDTQGTQFYMPQLDVTAGSKWDLAYDSRVVYGSGTAKIAVDWYDAGGVYLGEDVGPVVTLPASTTTGGTWTRVAGTFTAPANAVNAHPMGIGDFGTATGTDFKSTACDYELSTGTTPPPTTVPPTTVPPTTVPPTTVPPTTVPPTTVPPPPPPADGTQAAVLRNWGAPVAGDEFNYSGPADPAKWSVYGASDPTGCWPGHAGNGRRCASTVTVANGALTIHGLANGDSGGLAWNGSQKYGRYEVRMRLNADPGATGFAYHPVLIQWPQSDVWPQDGEYDYAETDIGHSDMEAFLHYPGPDGSHQTHDITPVNLTQWHNYAFEWEPTGLTAWIDGVQFFHYTDPALQAPGPMHQTIQLDNFCGCTMQAATQDVDWYRAYPA